MKPDRQTPGSEDEIDPAEIEAAADETPQSEIAAPEINPATERLTAWDEVPTASGEAGPKIVPEDDTPNAELLVNEGVDLADRDQRIAAADPDFEP